MVKCSRITIRKEKNRFAKGGFNFVVSQNGQRRFVKGTRSEAKKAANIFRKKVNSRCK